jgi:hypothetical protein
VFIVETARTSAAAGQVSEGVVVWKNFGVSPKYDTKNYERMRKDALAAERVGPHPLIVDIYGYCGLAQLDQAMPYGGLESVALPRGFEYGVSPRDEGGLEPRNSLLPSEKLSLALDMFEAVALLHNYGEGVIVHDDIQLVSATRLCPSFLVIRLFRSASGSSSSLLTKLASRTIAKNACLW